MRFVYNIGFQKYQYYPNWQRSSKGNRLSTRSLVGQVNIIQIIVKFDMGLTWSCE